MSHNNETNDSQESVFLENEMFVSKTDKKGTIQFYNEVFLRVSGYSKEELFKKPHNVIRHPDMPKSVFKLFWDTLKKNELIAVYVKNREKSGKYYWVFALAIPTKNGYFSIRIKPLSDYKNQFENLYKTVLEIEATDGLAAADLKIQEFIKSNGFSSYKEFMLEAILKELTLKNKSYLNTSNKLNEIGFSGFLQQIKILSAKSALSFAENVEEISKFANKDIMKSEELIVISDVFKKLDYLSFNMSIVAHRLGKLGNTLSVVSSNFQNTARNVMKQFTSFKNEIEKNQKNLNEVILGACCSRIQNEMLFFMVTEMEAEIKLLKSNQKIAIEEKINVLSELIDSISEIFHSTYSIQKNFSSDLNKFKKEIVALLDLVIRLDLIKTCGKLEGSRSIEVVQAFQPFIVEMTEFISTVQTPFENVLSTITEMNDCFQRTSTSAGLTEYTLKQLQLALADMSQDNNNAKNTTEKAA